MSKSTMPSLGIIAVAVALTFSYREMSPLYAGDIIALALLALLLWWLWKPSGETEIGVGDTPASKDPPQSRAFRLGKSLNRILGRSNLRGVTARTDDTG